MEDIVRISFRKLIGLSLVFLLMVTVTGCESLSRKFIRKSKQEKEPVQMVLAPEEYHDPAITKEEKYRIYFFYWESWHEELIQALNANGNKKKQIDSAEQAVKNLTIVRSLLDTERQKALDGYLTRLNEFVGEVKNDSYNSDSDGLRSRAETLKREIKRDFSCAEVKGALP